MDARSLLLEQVREQIEAAKLYWASRGKAAFGRVEGGLKRQIFLSDTCVPFKGCKDPEEDALLRNIDWLFVDEEKKKHLKYLYSLLTPGTMLLVFDTDADIEIRIGEPLIC